MISYSNCDGGWEEYCQLFIEMFCTVSEILVKKSLQHIFCSTVYDILYFSSVNFQCLMILETQNSFLMQEKTKYSSNSKYHNSVFSKF